MAEIVKVETAWSAKKKISGGHAGSLLAVLGAILLAAIAGSLATTLLVYRSKILEHAFNCPPRAYPFLLEQKILKDTAL